MRTVLAVRPVRSLKADEGIGGSWPEGDVVGVLET